MPKALGFHIDSIFKASSDVVGIQVFSNISTLDPLQKTASDHAKMFSKHVNETMKLWKTDLKKMQEEIIKSVQETTRVVAGLYTKRSDFEAARSAVKYLCCPTCGCVYIDQHCEPRLTKCEQDICVICDDVQKTFCDEGYGEQKQAQSRLG